MKKEIEKETKIVLSGLNQSELNTLVSLSDSVYKCLVSFDTEHPTYLQKAEYQLLYAVFSILLENTTTDAELNRFELAKSDLIG
jgi:hypothetical protein